MGNIAPRWKGRKIDIHFPSNDSLEACAKMIKELFDRLESLAKSGVLLVSDEERDSEGVFKGVSWDCFERKINSISESEKEVYEVLMWLDILSFEPVGNWVIIDNDLRVVNPQKIEEGLLIGLLYFSALDDASKYATAFLPGKKVRFWKIAERREREKTV